MSIIDPTVAPAVKSQFSLTRAKKAWGAGVAGLITGFGTISLSGIFADGKIDGTETLSIIGSVVGGFVLGFVGAWLPSNEGASAPGKNDALVAGDGLGGPDHAA